jgi:hypothetical protein
VPLPGYREQFMAHPFSGTASGLDRMAVGTQRDHLLGVVRAALGEILDVVHFQDRPSGIGDVLRHNARTPGRISCGHLDAWFMVTWPPDARV